MGSKQFSVGLIHRSYKLLLSPFFGERCRFHPTCSDYAAEALREHGMLRGMLLTLRRVVRCHPWSAGGFDYVPSSCQEQG